MKKSKQIGWTFVDQDGYVVICNLPGRPRCVKEHRLIWEQHHGPVPSNIDIHHMNKIRTDNRIENLEALDRFTHGKRHADCYQDDAGNWMKPCRVCKEYKPLMTHFYAGMFRCKKCNNVNSNRCAKIRRAKQKDLHGKTIDLSPA